MPTSPLREYEITGNLRGGGMHSLGTIYAKSERGALIKTNRTYNDPEDRFPKYNSFDFYETSKKVNSFYFGRRCPVCLTDDNCTCNLAEHYESVRDGTHGLP